MEQADPVCRVVTQQECEPVYRQECTQVQVRLRSEARTRKSFIVPSLAR